MTQTSISPQQIRGMAELTERVEALEIENAALRCALRGIYSLEMLRLQHAVALAEADKLAPEIRHRVREKLESLNKRAEA